MKEICLGSGRVAWLDDVDYERLKGFKWFCVTKGGSPYVARNAPAGATSGRRWRNQFMHHDILPFPWFGFTVDHADGNPLNNQRANLRYATPLQQSWNTRRRTEARKGVPVQSRYTGVTFDATRKKWRVEIHHQGVRVRLGDFDNEVDAARAWNAAATEHRGEFAKLNKV